MVPAGSRRTAGGGRRVEYGWRTWFVMTLPGDELEESGGKVWPADRTAATCPKADHAAPAAGCRCGWSAVSEPGAGVGPGSVLGLVELSGTVLRNADELRASYARPLLLVAGEGCEPRHGDLLAERYGVPVHRVGLPARVLARRLGAEPEITSAIRRDPAGAGAILARHESRWQIDWTRERARVREEARPERRELRARKADGTLWRLGLRGVVWLGVVPTGLTALFTWMARDHLEAPATTFSQVLIGLALMVLFAPVAGGCLGTVETLRGGRPAGGVQLLLSAIATALCVLTFRLVAYGPSPTTALLPIGVGLVAIIMGVLVACAPATPGDRDR